MSCLQHLSTPVIENLDPCAWHLKSDQVRPLDLRFGKLEQAPSKTMGGGLPPEIKIKETHRTSLTQRGAEVSLILLAWHLANVDEPDSKPINLINLIS